MGGGQTAACRSWSSCIPTSPARTAPTGLLAAVASRARRDQRGTAGPGAVRRTGRARPSDAYQRLMELGAGERDWPAVDAKCAALSGGESAGAAAVSFSGAGRREDRSRPDGDRGLPRLAATRSAESGRSAFPAGPVAPRAGDPAARRQVLQALEEAPRYRDGARIAARAGDRQRASAARQTPLAGRAAAKPSRP